MYIHVLYLYFQCGNESARIDTYLDIPLVIRPFGSTTAYKSVVSFREIYTSCNLIEIKLPY